MVRDSLRYGSKKHRGRITAQMREIYTAPTVEAAETRFADFAAEWQATYPAMSEAWRSVWNEFVPFLEFPAELRKVVYTTNAIESLNARFRRAVRHRGHFPTEQAAPDKSSTSSRRRSGRIAKTERQDQRLENHPQHPHRPLRRPDRRQQHQLKIMTATTPYTENLTVPANARRELRCDRAP